MTRTTRPTAGGVLAATTAMQDPHRIYTRDEVAYLMHLAYEAGRLHAAAEDHAETAACWAEFAQPRPTREQRVAERLAEMDRVARMKALREDRPYRVYHGGEVDWATGEPVQSPRRHLEVAA